MRRFLLASLVLLVPLHACTSDTNGDTDTDTDTDDGSSSSSGTSGTPMATGSTSETSSSSSGDDESSSSSSTSGEESSSSSSSSGGADDSSSGEAFEDICVGYTLLGSTSEVSSDGTAVGEPMCSLEPAACQGDVVGTWTVEDSCGYEVLPNFFEELCAGATQQITGTTSSGTRTFDADGTFVFDVVLQIEADLQVDSMACLGLACASFGETLSEDDGFEMVCEDGEGSSCNCIYAADFPMQNSGEWEILDDTLLVTSDSGEVTQIEYCVADGRLTTWTPLFDETPFPDIGCAEDEDCDGQVDGDFDAIGCAPLDDDEL